MTFLNNLAKSIFNNLSQNAFCINETYYSYKILFQKVSGIRLALKQESDKAIGLVTNDDLETYASIFALWLEGKAYIPLNPLMPIERNFYTLNETDSKIILDSSELSKYKSKYKVIQTQKLNDIENITLQKLKPVSVSENDLAYILFTSGSTGKPKGVPITYKNVNSFINALNEDGTFVLNKDDRCLQMFELTFDMSVVSYLTPILAGACVYTIPKDAMKYFYTYKLLTQYKLTILTMVPSVINYLRPYFKEISANQVRYSTFAGGKLDKVIAEEWNQCIPNATIINYYGPTEATIYSGFYKMENNSKNKALNGTLSIGKSFPGTKYIVIDENENILGSNQEGELCISGEQVTPGYWKNSAKNKEVFFNKNIDDEEIRFYKSGDLCFRDHDEDYMYVGRIDFQVKIRGYRVELGEVEYNAKIALPGYDLSAIDITNELGNTELGMVIVASKFNTDSLSVTMKEKLPQYMIPTKFVFVNELPLNTNGKIDRKALRLLF